MKKWFFTALMLFSSLALSSGPPPVKPAEMVGPVNDISQNKIIVADRVVALSPTVKVVMKSGRKASLSDVKIGRMVALETFTLGKRLLVDKIILIGN